MGGYQGLYDYFRNKRNKNDEIDTLLNSIKTGVDRANDIVRGLNQFSKSSDSFHEKCHIHDILNNCITILQHKIKNKINLKTEFCCNDIIVAGNEGKLHQVFINILSNSIDAIENTGTIIISTKKENSWAIIEITDTGCGISIENISKVINPFYTTKEPGKGTGLGLSITYTIIQEHKGDIEIKSVLNKGTTIITKFPTSLIPITLATI